MTEQFTATGTFYDSSTENLTRPGDVGVEPTRTSVATITSRRGWPAALWRQARHKYHTDATLNGHHVTLTVVDGLTSAAAVSAIDRSDAGQPEHRQG